MRFISNNGLSVIILVSKCITVLLEYATTTATNHRYQNLSNDSFHHHNPFIADHLNQHFLAFLHILWNCGV